MGVKERLKGCTFGRLKVLGFWESATDASTRWLCQCLCGNRLIIGCRSLSSGNTKSCGCLKRERAVECSTTHGKVSAPEYNSWRGAVQRCTNPKCSIYYKYGGRGIDICEQWKDSFESFYSDMGNKPSPNHSLDRIDNSRGYSKENCRWATRKQQARNTRTTKRATVAGRTLTVSEWSERTGQSPLRILGRLRKGWPQDEAVFGRKPPIYHTCKHVILFDKELYETVMKQLGANIWE